VKVSVEANAEAKSTLDDYISFQKGIQEKLQAGEIPTEADQKKMVDFNKKKVQANPLLTEYFTKQQQLGTYVARFGT
jgi:cell fate (sporulation/competence/biofilm development) regulator YlbF (YheA/YmcA/DUF963 family)